MLTILKDIMNCYILYIEFYFISLQFSEILESATLQFLPLLQFVYII